MNVEREQPYRIALIGFPNSGKSTLFNALTGQNERVGNFSGVTVESKYAYYRDENHQLVKVVDLPGCYALENSDLIEGEGPLDEKITQDFLNDNPIDLFVNVVDATHIERELSLTLELLEYNLKLKQKQSQNQHNIQPKVLIVLNKMDMALKQKISIFCEGLSKRLDTPVIVLNATRKVAMHELKQAILKIMSSQRISSLKGSQPFETPSMPLNCGVEPHEKWEKRYAKVDTLLKEVLIRRDGSPTLTQKIDAIVLNRWLGIPIFLVIMYALFLFTFQVGGICQEALETSAHSFFVIRLEHWLMDQGFSSMWISLLAHGLGQGIRTLITFIPVMGTLFFGLAFLESSGYLARAAFVVDKFMQILGLPGKALIPLVIGFGCNVPAIMGTRVLDNYRERVLTTMMIPFMSCSGRFAIYVLLASAFFPTGGANIIFGLYILGIMVAIFTSVILRKNLLLGDNAPLILELPDYCLPSFKSLLKQSVYRLKRFLIRAGALIIPLCVFFGGLWAYQSGEEPFVASFARTLMPIFAPMGLDEHNWPALVGLLTGVLAKEVVVGTLTSLYSQLTIGLETTSTLLTFYFHNTASVIAYLLFVLLYFPCVSVVATMAKELNKSWALFSVVWSMSLAYGISVMFYQAATFLEHPMSSILWMGGIVLAFYVGLKVMIKVMLMSVNLRDKAKNNLRAHKPIPTPVMMG